MPRYFIKSMLFVFVVALILLIAQGHPSAQMMVIDSRGISSYGLFIGTTKYLPLVKACELYGIEYDFDERTRKVFLYKKGNFLVFMPNDVLVNINGKIRKLSCPPRIVSGSLMIPEEIIQFEWWRKVAAIPQRPLVYRPEEFIVDRVVIDAGHGGKDPGAIGYGGLKEKDIVLSVARQVEKELEKKNIEVIMTRGGDKFIPLAKRAEISTNSGADLFVSIHANANRSSNAKGYEIYYLSEAVDDSARAVEILENSALEQLDNPDFPNKFNFRDPTLWDLIFTENRQESIELARDISASLGRFGKIKDRGVKTAKFHVLKWTDKPAILIELGFITNKDDANHLRNSSNHKKIASLIADGVLKYKKRYEKTKGFTSE